MPLTLGFYQRLLITTPSPNFLSVLAIKIKKSGFFHYYSCVGTPSVSRSSVQKIFSYTMFRARNSNGTPTQRIMFRGTSSSVWVFRRSTWRGGCCSAEHLPPYGCSVGVPGAEDVVPRNIFLRLGVPLEYPARRMLLRGASSSVWVFRWSTQRGGCCSAEHLPPCGCSVGVPAAEDVAPRSIFLRVGIPLDYPARRMLLRGASSSA